MTDEDVAALLDSTEPLVVIEAPAGCGKTYQGANFARRSAQQSRRGRTLVLTHTHSARSQFAKETRATANKIEIKTIDSLVVQIATVYHKSLDLPPDPSAWARQQKRGFEELGSRVARLLTAKRIIAHALADRYPDIIADEHQDSSAQQHEIVMAIHSAGSRLRVFGDPMQAIFGKGKKAAPANRQQWNTLKSSGRSAELEQPHRWRDSSPDLGKWILQARQTLRDGGIIDLTTTLPIGLRILFADNTAANPTGYQLSQNHRHSIDKVVDSSDNLFVLSSHKDTVEALRAFWQRRLPIWEGHSREPLGELVTELATVKGNATAVANAALAFVAKVCKGFSPSSHGNRFVQEVDAGCCKPTTGKPALIQDIARFIVDDPSHIGVARCLRRLSELVEAKADGFSEVCIDYRSEYRDAVKLEGFTAAEEGLTEIVRRRSFAHPMPPAKSISTIHKAKGLECDNALVVPCDKKHFSDSDAARCKLYVALSRARRHLTLVVSRASPSLLLKIS